MKHITIFVSIMLLFFMISNAQQIIHKEEVPEQVMYFFPIVYPLADSVHVTWFEQDSLFIAQFTVKEFPVKVLFKENGFWVQTIWTIDCSYLPKSITNYIRIDYVDYRFSACQLTNNAFDERTYLIELEPISEKEPIILTFTIQGQLIK